MSCTISQAARRSGCPASAIRYYERIGLVGPAERCGNGYRCYDADAITRLAFVHRARALGFSVAAVGDLLRLADHPDAPCDTADELLAEQCAAIARRIAELQRLEAELRSLQAECAGGHVVAQCGVLAALAPER